MLYFLNIDAYINTVDKKPPRKVSDFRGMYSINFAKTSCHSTRKIA